MNTDVLETRQTRPSSLTQKEKFKEWILYFLLALTLVGLATLGTVHLLLISKSDLHRSEEDIKAGGKRFIDYSYSLHAASVDLDQFRALQMIVNEDLRNQEKERIIKQDLIRKSRSSMMQSRVDWRGAKVTLKKQHDNGVYEVEYETQLVRNGRSSNPIHIILFLAAVPKSDSNPDGVGVLGWHDFAEEPFDQGEKNDS